MALAKINGRTQFFNCTDFAISKVGSGKFSVTADGRTFEVIGGTESGGAAHEWFCHCPIFYGDRWLPTKSMVEAIKAGINC